jgi:hypothetical protein
LRAGTYTLSIVTWRFSGGGSLQFKLGSLAQLAFTDIDASPYNASSDTVSTDGATDKNHLLEVCNDLVIPTDGDYALKVTAGGGAPAHINLVLFERTGA